MLTTYRMKDVEEQDVVYEKIKALEDVDEKKLTNLPQNIFRVVPPKFFGDELIKRDIFQTLSTFRDLMMVCLIR